MVDIVAKDRRDAHSQQGEDGKDRLSRLAHVAHIAINNQRNDRRHSEEDAAHLVLLEVAGESTGSHNNHDDILHDGDR